MRGRLAGAHRHEHLRASRRMPLRAARRPRCRREDRVIVRPRVVIVQHSARSGAGRLYEWLADDGIDPVVVAGPDLPERLADWPAADGVVLLGGPFLPDDDARAPFLPRERLLVGEAITTGVPVLGICLGAQVLAHVCGGEVTAKSGEGERGSCAITLLPTAADDPLFAGLTRYRDLRMIQNHQDSI